MEITKKIKERFCKDCDIPIKIFHEPYFTERMGLLDDLYNTKVQWDLFMQELDKFPADRDYLDAADAVRTEAIDYVKSTDAYKRFNSMDMNAYTVKNRNLPTTAIYKPSNDGRVFISVDMRKANFSALRQFDPDVFGGAKTWEEFIGRFTASEHIKRSKYIRQVVMGNCNPSRHVTLAKYYMDKILTDLDLVPYVVYFAGDEFVLCADNVQEILDQLQSYTAEVPIRVSIFTLKAFRGVEGYRKEFLYHPEGKKLEIKGVSNYDIPFVARAFKGEEIQESDKVFYHEKRLAIYLDVPTVEL